MAEHILRRCLASVGLDGEVSVASAGLFVTDVGGPADPRAVAALTRGGYSSRHAVCQVSRDLIADSDLIIALAAGHQAALRRLTVGWALEPDIRLLRSFDPGADMPDVPDPVGEDASAYLRVRDLIEAAIPGILATIRSALAPGWASA
jgi:protein-tyrosine phosphatase